MDWITLPPPPGSDVSPAVVIQWFILDDDYAFCAVGGVDFDAYPDGITGVLLPEEGRRLERMGKLSGQPKIFQIRVRNSLRQMGWADDLYPDPELILQERP